MLSPATIERVLAYLNAPVYRPDLPSLNRLLRAYTRTIPWESAFRIDKRVRTPITEPCVRWPEEFWAEAINRGGGGTCFESNYAFLSLIEALGYTGYLTINNMGTTIGCHTALVVWLRGMRYIVDVGMPLYHALPIDPDRKTQTRTEFHTYVLVPAGDKRFEIERTMHPIRNAYTFIDQPVTDADYRFATERDYGPQGLFLNRVVINKVIGDSVWRFNSGVAPYQLERINRSGQSKLPLPPDEPAAALAKHFGMDEGVLQRALATVTTAPPAAA